MFLVVRRSYLVARYEILDTSSEDCYNCIMSRPKIKAAIKTLILRLSRKSGHLGLRGISRVLRQKYNLIVSKSSIAAILKEKGFQQTRGRKPAILEHKERINQQCGLLLLLCLDSHLGLIDHVAHELKVLMPQLGQEQLKKILIFQSFSIFALPALQGRQGQDGLLSPELTKDFLRLCGLSRLPRQALADFKKTIEHKKPTIFLQAVRQKLNLISTLKFYFADKSTGFTDGRMTTFWDDICRFERFYFPLQAVLARLEQMLKDNVLIIGYTKSFEYLSRLTLDFVKGIKSGIEKIELLDKDGNVIRSMKLVRQKIVLVFGYCPAIVTKGIVVFPGGRRLSKISAERVFEFYASTALVRFSQPAELFLSQILLKEHFASAFQWGVFSTISNKSRQLVPFLKKYLYMWRYVADDFFKDMEAIQKAVVEHEKKPALLSNMLPRRLQFNTVTDCVRISQILSVLFKEIVYGWESKAKSGAFSLGKEALYIYLEAVPPQLKKHFNSSGFTFAKRPAILV